MFDQYTVIVYENDSSDATRRLLMHAMNTMPLHVMGRRFLGATIRSRVARIAYARQCMLGAARRLARGVPPTHVLVMDLDDVGSHPGSAWRFVRTAMSRQDLWDAAFPRPSYDRFAFWRNAPTKREQDAAFEALSRGESRDGRAERVQSSFNGIGLYKWDLYRTGRYYGRASTQSRSPPCEHVVFHASLGPQPRLMVLPDVGYPI